MPIDEDVRQVLLSMVQGFRIHAEELTKTNASIFVLRRAIASSHQDPAEAEKELRQLEATAQDYALQGLKSPVSDAILELLKAGKKPDDFDS